MLTIYSGTPEQPIREETNCISSFVVLNTDSPTRLHGNANPQFSRCIISISLSHHLVRMANTHNHELRPSAHPCRITDNCHLIFHPAQNLHQPQESCHHLLTDCQKDEKLFRATLLNAAPHHISTGIRKFYTQEVPVDILAMMGERYDLGKQEPRLAPANDNK